MVEEHSATRMARVITVSDSSFRGTRMDSSGPRVADILRGAGYSGCEIVVVPDEVAMIGETLRAGAADGCALIVTTGGTGLALRDVTPEATLQVCERLVPGLPELMRSAGLRETRYAPLSRGVCGTLGRTLILNLPGSPAGAESSLRTVLALLPHALELLAGKTEHTAIPGKHVGAG